MVKKKNIFVFQGQIKVGEFCIKSVKVREFYFCQASRFAKELPCKSIQKMCVKDLISTASLLPKDLSWMVSEKSGDFFFSW